MPGLALRGDIAAHGALVAAGELQLRGLAEHGGAEGDVVGGRERAHPVAADLLADYVQHHDVLGRQLAAGEEGVDGGELGGDAAFCVDGAAPGDGCVRGYGARGDGVGDVRGHAVVVAGDKDFGVALFAGGGGGGGGGPGEDVEAVFAGGRVTDGGDGLDFVGPFFGDEVVDEEVAGVVFLARGGGDFDEVLVQGEEVGAVGGGFGEGCLGGGRAVEGVLGVGVGEEGANCWAGAQEELERCFELHFDGGLGKSGGGEELGMAEGTYILGTYLIRSISIGAIRCGQGRYILLPISARPRYSPNASPSRSSKGPP